MKITQIQTYLVPPRWLFLKIETDEGIVGWGEPIIEGKAKTVQVALQEFEEQLIGMNPLEIEHIWQKMYRGSFYRGGAILMSAIAGVNQALWDIKGKYLESPVHALLGGPCRKKIRVYSWIGGDSPNSPEKTAEQALEMKQRGFNAIKMNGCGKLEFIDTFHTVDNILQRVDAVRSAVGISFDIAIDFHGRVHKSMAKILLKELECYHPFFVEEPVLPEYLHMLPEIANVSTIPIATGERLFTKYEFRTLLERGCVSIVQPDISHAGGISECIRIATIADTYDVSISLHCPLGPIALASALHVDAIVYNMLIQEQSSGIHYNTEGKAEVVDYVENKDALKIENGYIIVPTGHGLGITMNENLIKERSKNPHAWSNPIWHNKDGSIAEW